MAVIVDVRINISIEVTINVGAERRALPSQRPRRALPERPGVPRYAVLECGTVFDLKDDSMPYVGKAFDLQDRLDLDERLPEY